MRYFEDSVAYTVKSAKPSYKNLRPYVFDRVRVLVCCLCQYVVHTRAGKNVKDDRLVFEKVKRKSFTYVVRRRTTPYSGLRRN